MQVKRVVSVSLGSSQRDSCVEVDLFGQPFRLQRIGADGDKKRFAALVAELDGKVDAITVGGADLYLYAGKRRYRLEDAAKLVRGVTRTPVVDGSGLKHALEAETVRRLQAEGIFDFRGARVLLVSATDRWGMAQALSEAGAQLVIGDLIFALGLPFPLTRLWQVVVLAAVLLPILRRLPIEWLYPTGKQQTEIVPKHQKYYQWADMIAGDFLLIRRHLPERLEGKAILTNTTTPEDVNLLRARGVRLLVTSTPRLAGRTFGTNLIEGALVAASGAAGPLPPEQYVRLLNQWGWRPQVEYLQESPVTERKPAS